MKPEYAAWIMEHCPDYKSAYGMCSGTTVNMVEAFPELRRVRGHYHCPSWGEREHWWCVDERGSVVDPTAHQFPGRAPAVSLPLDVATARYEEFTGDDSELPTGVCMDCGLAVYNDATFCSSGCEEATCAYLNDIGKGGDEYES
jgi:hypothetical protein